MLQKYLWLIYALGAAVMWGLQYATSEQLLKTIPTTFLTVTYTVAQAFIYIIIFGFLSPKLGNLSNFTDYLSGKNLYLFALVVALGCGSTLLIFAAISEGTATKASFIEISYPFFVAIFATWIYREGNVDAKTLLGGILIFLGILTMARS
jgi:drug/metabolite transporter (DMT)-like permease